MERLISTILATRDNFFARRGWQRKRCSICLEDYYTKRDLPNCGSYRCVCNYQFLNIPPPRSYLELDVCVEHFRRFFVEKGYPLELPIALVRSDERTLFASTAGQVYDDLIYNQTLQKDSKRCLVLQPVVRLQRIDLIDTLDGISTSFIHAATECWNILAEEHWSILDQWLDFFSTSGLHVGGLCLKSQRADNDWAGHMVTSEMLKINYGGLEIGIANFFFNIPQNTGTFATLSDIGVGLERFLWATNKSPSYFDSIGPISSFILNRVMFDAIRTATLMTASGVVPDHKNQGSKLRMMVGLIANDAQRLNLYELVGYYYEQWASFINLPMSREDTYSIIRRELNRSLNFEANRTLEIEEPLEQDHEEFLRGVIRKKIVPIAQLWNIKKRTT